MTSNVFSSGISKIQNLEVFLQDEIRKYGELKFHSAWEIPKASSSDLVIGWGIGQIDAINRSDLLEIIEDRCGVGSILVTSVLPVKAWAGYIKDPTYSDSILDRLVRNAFRINMNGESMRGQTRYGAVPIEENTEK